VRAADVVMGAVSRIAGEGGSVTLAQVQADPDVQRVVMSSSRVTDIMGTLEDEHQVRMTARHPVPTWRVVTQEEK
jgi:hypothetical protein